MRLQPEFYLHIITGGGGHGGPALARLALRLGASGDEPFDVAELLLMGGCARSSMDVGTTELYVAEYIRACVMGDAKPWTEDQAERLRKIAARG